MDANAAERRAAASTEADNAEAAEQAAAYFDSLKRGPSVASDAPDAEAESATRKRGNREMAARVDLLYREAQSFMEEEPPTPTEALQLMQKAIYVAPQDDRLYALRAECYVKACDFRSAVLNLRKSMACIEANSGVPSAVQRRLSQVLDAQGLSLLRSTVPGSQEQAEEAFTFAMEADRMAHGPPFHLALARFVRKDYSGALDSLGVAIGLAAATDARLYLLRAKVHWATKNFGHAALDVVSGLRIDQTLADLIALDTDLRAQSDESFNTGTDLMIKKDYHAALASLKTACSMDPANGQKLLRQGIAERLCGDSEKAIDDLKLTLELLEDEREDAQNGLVRRSEDSRVEDVFTAKKQLGITYNQLGMRAYDDGDYVQAYNIFTKALEVERARAYLVNRGDCLREQGHLDACISDYAEAIETREIRPPSQMAKDAAADPNGDSDKGEEVEVDEAPNEVKVRVAVAFNEVGMQLYQRHQYAESFDYFSKSIEHLPEVLEYRLNRFHAADACGQLQAAKEDLQTAVRLEPDNTYVRSRLRDLETASSKDANSTGRRTPQGQSFR
jgi:tetratricopeptide (TPR) repeat protein